MSRVLDPAESLQELCDELRAVFEVAHERYGAELGHADYDIRAASINFTMSRELSRAEIAELALLFDGAPHLEFGDCYVVCRAHWCCLDLGRPG